MKKGWQTDLSESMLKEEECVINNVRTRKMNFDIIAYERN